METDDTLWKPKLISWGGMRIEARVRTFDTNVDCDAFLHREMSSVIANGGALFYHVKKPPMEEVRTPGIPGVGYRYPYLPTPELWYIPTCRFEDLLEVIRFFGFPNQIYANDPDAVFGVVKSLLIEFHRRKPLAITQVDDSHIMLDLVKSGNHLDEQEASEIIEFNKERFGVRETKREERDKKRNWMKHQFFTVGAI